LTDILIVGGGQAGFQCAASLRAEGYDQSIVIATDEAAAPYQKPPLSKEFLSGAKGEEALWFRPPAFFEQQGIEIRTGHRADRIDRDKRTVWFNAGGPDETGLPYASLILATGARARPLPMPVEEGASVLELRTLEDARALKGALEAGGRCAVIGGGYIGLEVAAAARKAGLEVSVIEAQDRVLSRVAPPVISEYFEALHRHNGVELILGASVERIGTEAVHLADGRTIPCDFVVSGIGVLPNQELAERAGLACANGVVVDEALRTSDPDIFAIGDCAQFPCVAAGCEARLESVQNAADQGRAVAKTILGKGAPYADTPWFWTIQYDTRLQTAGIPAGFDAMVRRGEDDAFSIFYYRDGALIAVDSVNQPADHMAARMMLTKGLSPAPADIEDASWDLRAWLKAAG